MDDDEAGSSAGGRDELRRLRVAVEPGTGEGSSGSEPAPPTHPAERAACSAPEPGQRLGEYVLVSPLGEGGFASVWLAQHRFWPERRAAAKLIRDPEQLHQLGSEARCLASLSHENIAGAIGLDLENDPPYLLVELHEGRTLRQVLEQDGPLPPARVKRLFGQVVAALACSHAQGVVHGDVKPENILVSQDDRVKVADFGLGRVRALQTSTRLSQSVLTGDGRTVAGTIPYMAPEQQAGHAPDVLTDVFTLGILLHELATGTRPQPGDELVAALPDDPAHAAAFARCYARRERRFADAAELARALPLEALAGEARAPLRVRAPAPWTPEEVEDAVRREAGIDLDALRSGERFADRRARTTAMFLLHHHLGMQAPELAERFQLPARTVRAKLEMSAPAQALVVGAGERLAPLPPDTTRRLARLDTTLTAWLALGIALGGLSLGGGVILLAQGTLPLPAFALLVWLPLLALAAAEACRVRYRAARATLAHIVPTIDAATDRERLERLAIRYDLPLVRRRARELLEEDAPPARTLAPPRRAVRRAATSARAARQREVEPLVDTTPAAPPVTVTATTTADVTLLAATEPPPEAQVLAATTEGPLASPGPTDLIVPPAAAEPVAAAEAATATASASPAPTIRRMSLDEALRKMRATVEPARPPLLES